MRGGRRRRFSSGWWDDSKERTEERVEKRRVGRQRRSRKDRGQAGQVKDKKVEARQGKPNCGLKTGRERAREGRGEGTNERASERGQRWITCLRHTLYEYSSMAMCMDTHKKESCGWSTSWWLWW